MQLDQSSFSIKHNDNSKINFGNDTSEALVERQDAPGDQTSITLSATDFSSILQNQTNQLLASGSKQYNGTVWAILSASLFVGTLLLPLIGPDLFRYIIQGVYKSRAYWRVYCLIGFFIYFIMIYWVIPAIFAHLYFAVESFDLNGNLYLTDSAKFNDGNFINLVSFVTSAFVLGCFCLWRLIIAIRSETSRHKSRRIKVWLGFGVVLLASYLIDAYTSYDLDWNPYLDTGFSVSTIVPWTYLVSVAVVPSIGRWYKRSKNPWVAKTRRLSVDKINIKLKRKSST